MIKHWQGQLFPVIILSVLAALTFWLQRAVEVPLDKHDGKYRHDPDGIAENFVAKRFDENGIVKYRLAGPIMRHYPDDDSSELRSPLLTVFRPGQPDMNIASDFAKITAKGSVVYLWDNVRLTRAADGKHAAMLARMPYLTVEPDAGFAFTDSPVEITQGDSWLTGVGARINNDTSTFVLQSQVKGYYLRPKNSP